jgi:hypothetical protein
MIEILEKVGQSSMPEK